MATVISKEKENFVRIGILLHSVSPAAVRVTFDKCFPSGGLQIVLNQNRKKVLDGLSNKRIINSKQWNLLFPQTGNANSETFDVTLMICLLRNIQKIPVQDQLPVKPDTSIGADLSRIKFYRNKIAHSDEDELSDDQFNEIWEELSQATIRLGGPTYKQTCADYKICQLDNNYREILTEIRSLSQNVIPKGLSGVHAEEILEWKSLEPKLVKTNAIKHLLNLLESKECVVVVGPSGCGKSTAIHHVSLHLKEKLGYTIIPAEFPNDITQFYEPDVPQIFVFDDICGKCATDYQRLENWHILANKIQKILASKKVKILASCRTNIYRDRQFSWFSKIFTVICDMTSDNLSLSDDERSSIATSYLTAEEVEQLQALRTLPVFSFFPLLCQMYSLNKCFRLEDYFKAPVEFIKTDLAAYMNSKDQTLYGTLALFVIYNNRITEDHLRKDSGIKDILTDISDECQMPSLFSIKVVRSQLETQVCSYVKKTANTFSIIHDKIFDILVSFYGEHLFDIILQHCHSSFLRERFKFESSTNIEDDLLIKVPACSEEAFINRLMRDIKDGHIEDVFTNSQLPHCSFENTFVSCLRQRPDLHSCILELSGSESSPLLTVAKHGHCRLLLLLIQIGMDVNVPDRKGLTPLHHACTFDYFNIAETLFQNGADPDIPDTKDKMPFHIGLINGYLPIVELLFKEDMATCCGCGISPIFISCVFGYIEIVKFFLDRGYDPTISDSNGISLFYVASYRGHLDIVKLLLQKGCDPNACTYFNESPLFAAAQMGHVSVVQLLLEIGCNPNICTKTIKATELDMQQTNL